VTIAALDRLAGMWPRGERIEDLANAVADAPINLAGAMLSIVAMDLADLRTRRLEVAAEVSERPVASRMARVEAEEGDVITSLLHRSIQMEDRLARDFVRLLDGARDHAALVDALAAGHPEVARDTIDAQVRTNLLELCRSGVLAG